MNNSTLIKILNTFSRKEIKRLQEWLHSPIHNKNTEVLNLYEMLISDEVQLKTQLLDKKLIWALIFPNKPYQDGKMRKLIHLLLKATEAFLSYQYQEESPLQQQLNLLKVLRQKQLSKLYYQVHKTTIKELDKNKIANYESIRLRYELLEEQFIMEEAEKRTKALSIQEISDSLDLQYFSDLLRKACLFHSRKVVHKVAYQIPMLPFVLEQIKQQNYTKIPAIGIYYYYYLSITSNEEQYFEQMLELLYQYDDRFPTTEIRELYLLAINYSIRQLNTGAEKQVDQTFELYKKGIERGFLLQKNQLSPWTYSNTASLGIRLKKFEWVEQFLHQYFLKINTPNPQIVFSEAFIKLLYAKKEYKKAVELLISTNFKDTLQHLTTQILLAKIYYETEEIDRLDTLLTNLKIYLRRKNLTSYHHQNYKNILFCMTKLVTVNLFDKKAVLNLQQTIEKLNPLGEKKWLLTQLNNLT